MYRIKVLSTNKAARTYTALAFRLIWCFADKH